MPKTLHPTSDPSKFLPGDRVRHLESGRRGTIIAPEDEVHVGRFDVLFDDGETLNECHPMQFEWLSRGNGWPPGRRDDDPGRLRNAH